MRNQGFVVCCEMCGIERHIPPTLAGRAKYCSHDCARAAHRLQEKTLRHGYARRGRMLREYRAWAQMKTRVLNPNRKGFHRYGGRGITIDPRWVHSFETFLADMGPCPDGFTLERKDNDGPYSPENCRWASQEEQALNKSTIHFLTLRGVSLPASEWSKRIGMNYWTLMNRLHLGWDPERALTTPVRKA